jgi:hypothetical protein
MTNTAPDKNDQLLLTIIRDDDKPAHQSKQPHHKGLLYFELGIVFHNLVVSLDKQVLN